MRKIIFLTLISILCLATTCLKSKDIGKLPLDKIPKLGSKDSKMKRMKLSKSILNELPKALSSDMSEPESFLKKIKGLKMKRKNAKRRKSQRGKMMSEEKLWKSLSKSLAKLNLKKKFDRQAISKPKGMILKNRKRCPSFFTPCYCKPWDWCCIWKSIRRLVWYLYQLHWWLTWNYGCFWGKIYTIRILWRLLWRCPWWIRRWLWRWLIRIIWRWYCW